MKFLSILSFIGCLGLVFSLSAQEVKYAIPTTIQKDQLYVSFEDIVGDEGAAKMKVYIENTTDDYLACDLSNTVLKFKDLSYKAGYRKPLFVVPPKRKMSKVLEARGKNLNEETFVLQLHGVYHAPISDDYLDGKRLKVEQGNELSIGDFSITVLKSKTKKETTTAILELKYNGAQNSVGLIHVPNLKAYLGEEAIDIKAGKFNKSLLRDKRCKVNVTIGSSLANLELDFSKVLQQLASSEITFDPITIYKEGWRPKWKPLHANEDGKYNDYTEKNPVKQNRVLVYNGEGEGFKLEIEGASVTPYYTTSARIGMDSDYSHYRIYIDGIDEPVISRKVKFDPDLEFAKYRIRRTQSGDYAIAYVPGSGVRKGEGGTAATSTSDASTNSTEKTACLSMIELREIKMDLGKEEDEAVKVELALEKIAMKKCIASIQIAELLEEFRFGARRLELAKNAYQYVTDKNKYYLVIDKMKYASDKEKLEIYIENQ